MSKYILLFVCLITLTNNIVCAAPQANGFSGKFIKKFKTCEVYSEPFTFNMYGTVFHDYKQIMGWNGNYCGYKQITGTANGQLVVTCNFSRKNVKTLYNALLLKPDKYGKENPTEKIWRQYMHNPQICKFVRSEYYSKGFQVDEKYLPDF